MRKTLRDSVSLPDTSATQGITVLVPVSVSGTLTAGDNVLGYSFDLLFRRDGGSNGADPEQSFSKLGTLIAAGR